MVGVVCTAGLAAGLSLGAEPAAVPGLSLAAAARRAAAAGAARRAALSARQPARLSGPTAGVSEPRLQHGPVTAANSLSDNSRKTQSLCVSALNV